MVKEEFMTQTKVVLSVYLPGFMYGEYRQIFTHSEDKMVFPEIPISFRACSSKFGLRTKYFKRGNV